MDIPKDRVNKILFIKGVFIKDCLNINDLYENTILNSLKSVGHVEIIQYIKIPSVFTGVKSWIKKTNIHCHYCSRTFDFIPKFIPKSIEFNMNEYYIPTEGCFCTFNCGISYIDLFYPKMNDNINKKKMLNLLYKIYNGILPVAILPAPSKYMLQKYGGDLTDLEYGDLMPKII